MSLPNKLVSPQKTISKKKKNYEINKNIKHRGKRKYDLADSLRNWINVNVTDCILGGKNKLKIKLHLGKTGFV